MHLEVFDNHLVCESLYRSRQVMCFKALLLSAALYVNVGMYSVTADLHENMKRTGKVWHHIVISQAKPQLAQSEWSLCHIFKALGLFKRK